MRLRRYRKVDDEPGKFGLAWCNSSDFVAFWSDSKYVCGRDRDGKEWLLQGGLTLQKIADGDEGLTRIHRNCLVRSDAVESVRNATPANTMMRALLILGHEYECSRRYRQRWPVGEYQAVQQAA